MREFFRRGTSILLTCFCYETFRRPLLCRWWYMWFSIARCCFFGWGMLSTGVVFSLKSRVQRGDRRLTETVWSNVGEVSVVISIRVEKERGNRYTRQYADFVSEEFAYVLNDCKSQEVCIYLWSPALLQLDQSLGIVEYLGQQRRRTRTRSHGREERAMSPKVKGSRPWYAVRMSSGAMIWKLWKTT